MSKRMFCFFIIFSLLTQNLNAQYKLQPYDEIEINVIGQPELSRKVTIDPDGKIAIPLIGEIKASGVTVSELTVLIKEKIKDIVPITDINISLVSWRKTKVYIFGEINKPGEYTFDANEEPSLITAIAKSGGVTQQANLRRIEILKATGKTEYIDLKKMWGKDIILSHGDAIFIKRKSFISLELITTLSWLTYLWISIIKMVK